MAKTKTSTIGNSGSRAGGGASGGATSFEAYKKAAESKGFELDDSMRDYDAFAVGKIVEGVSNAIDEFPQLADYITVKAKDSGAPGAASVTGSLYFPKNHWSDTNTLADEWKRDTEPRNGYSVPWHPAGTSDLSSVSTHEAGHILEAMLIMKDGGFSGKYNDLDSLDRWYLVSQWNKRTQATSVVGEACRRVKKTPYGKGKKNDELIGSVSRYAGKNRSEALAECVTDYIFNRENANPLSIAVCDIIKDRLA